MTTTGHLAAIQSRCAAARARLIVAGDERQLGPVGAGGAFRLMSEHTQLYTLQEVRRFQSLWEAQASLRLRDGDQSALSEYERHGRIVDAGTSQQAAALAGRAWLSDTLAGRQSLLVVGTAEEAADLSARLRAQLVDLGRVSAHGVELHHEAATGTVAGVGDIIQSRRNDWRLRDVSGRPVVNRDLWQVTAVTPDGGLRVRRINGHANGIRLLGPEMNLPADYVASHVALGYALTVHSAQGSTVDTCYPIISATMSPNAMYVAMTRGRQHSVAHVVTANLADRPIIMSDPGDQTPPGANRRTAGQVMSAIMDRMGQELPAQQMQRDLLIAAGSLPVLGSRWSEAVSLSAGRECRGFLARLADEGHLPRRHYLRLLTDDALGPMLRLVRAAQLAGHEPYQLLCKAIIGRELDTAESVAEVLHYRITQRYGDALLPAGDTWVQRTPAGTDPVTRYARAVAEAMDARTAFLGEQCAVEPPSWAITHLGPPTGADWVRRAGIVAGYREFYRAGDDQDAIGSCPQPGLPDGRAAWFAAWRALGRPRSLAAESTMSSDELVAAVNVYARQREWAPDWVGDALRAEVHAARAHHQDAQLLRAKAAIELDPTRKAEQLTKAAAHAATVRHLVASTRDLAIIDDARRQWHIHTEPQRAAAIRAVAELSRRGKDPQGQPKAPGGNQRHNAHPNAGRDSRAREAVSFIGDINAALSKARMASARVAAERKGTHAVPEYGRRTSDSERDYAS